MLLGVIKKSGSPANQNTVIEKIRVPACVRMHTYGAMEIRVPCAHMEIRVSQHTYKIQKEPFLIGVLIKEAFLIGGRHTLAVWGGRFEEVHR